MRKKLTNDDVVSRINYLVGNEYEKLDKYFVNSLVKFPIRHNICGHEYEVKWANFHYGSRCPKCFGNEKYSNDIVVQKMRDLVGDEYVKVDEAYLNSQTKFLVKHNKCGHEYEVSWNSFQSGNRCPKCSRERRKKIRK